MAVRRFPSASDSLQQSTLRDDTLIPCRYKAGTVDDSDKAIPFSLMKSTPVAVCSSASATVTKVATVDNFPDFELVNGREVIVYFVNGNTATNPSMNINGTGAIALEGGYWNSGSFMKLKYVDITVSGTRIQKWLVDLGSFNSNAQINGALTNVQKKIKSVDVEVGSNNVFNISTLTSENINNVISCVGFGNYNSYTMTVIDARAGNFQVYINGNSGKVRIFYIPS